MVPNSVNFFEKYCGVSNYFLAINTVTKKFEREKIFEIVKWTFFLICLVSEISLQCHGTTYKNVSLTAYFPDYTNQDHEEGYHDEKGEMLRTLQV